MDWEDVIQRFSVGVEGKKSISIRVPDTSRAVADIYVSSEKGYFSHDWLIPPSGEIRRAPNYDIDFAHFIVDLHYFRLVPSRTQEKLEQADLFLIKIIEHEGGGSIVSGSFFELHKFQTKPRDLRNRNDHRRYISSFLFFTIDQT